MIRSGNVFRYILSVLFILVFMAIVANNLIYSHVHLLPDGTLLRHAHPYSKSNSSTGNQHSHSDLELLLLNRLESFLNSELRTQYTTFMSSLFIHRDISNVDYNYELLCGCSQRAPPCTDVF